MCRFRIDKEEFKKKFTVSFDTYFIEEQGHINRCVDDGLIRVTGKNVEATELGKIFIRNVCMGFDYYLRDKNASLRFSRTV